MKKIILILLLLSICICSNAQTSDTNFSFDKKTGLASENGKAIFKIISVGPKGEGEYSVKNLNDKELIFLKTSDFIDEKTISSTNPKGRVVFTEFIFYNSNSKAEIEDAYFAKHWAKLIYENKLILNNELDTEAVVRFIKIIGNDFSKRRDALNSNSKVIIIDNTNQNNSPRNGININVGN